MGLSDMAADILIVDDEADIRELISGILQDEGYETRLARNSDAALAALADRRPSLIVLDIWLQESKLDGLDLLTVIRERHPELPVVIISGHGNIETAVSAIKRGAYDYIEKPFNADRLILVVGRALEATRLRRENEALKGRTGADVELLGSSMAMRQLRQTLKKIAPSNSRILITGAMGAGKELAARSLHEMSQRANGPFVILSAATMAPERMEEELFGIEDGSGAPQRVGALEEAHSGTLYIDEIADMPVETQGKVLRVLVEQTFQRVGGGKKVKVDVRIVSSTGRDLSTLISEGRFREDLYHRLSVVPVRVPSLAERREDIPELIEYFSRLYSVASGQPHRKLATTGVAMQHRAERSLRHFVFENAAAGFIRLAGVDHQRQARRARRCDMRAKAALLRFRRTVVVEIVEPSLTQRDDFRMLRERDQFVRRDAIFFVGMMRMRPDGAIDARKARGDCQQLVVFPHPR